MVEQLAEQYRGTQSGTQLDTQHDHDDHDDRGDGERVGVEDVQDVVTEVTPHRYVSVVTDRFTRYREELSLPDAVMRMGVEMYCDLRACDEYRWRAHGYDVTVTATIVVATRVTNTPRTLNEILQVHGASQRQVMNARRNMTDVLDVFTTPIPADVYLDRIVNEFDLPDEVAAGAREIVESEVRHGRHPGVVACGAVWVAAAEHGECGVYQHELAESVACTPVAIQHTAQEIEDAC